MDMVRMLCDLLIGPLAPRDGSTNVLHPKDRKPETHKADKVSGAFFRDKAHKQ